MCFHYALTKQKAEIEIQLGVSWDDDWQPVYHADGFTFLKMPVITQKQPNRIQMFNWGVIPGSTTSKAAADVIKTKTLNARSETIFELPSFSPYIFTQRCLIPADGFFEWLHFQNKTYPHFIEKKAHELFCFAGIYSSWIDPTTGELINTFSIITCDANSMVGKIHFPKNRMPVIVLPLLYETWLRPGLTKEEIQTFFTPYPEQYMQNHTISSLVSSKTKDSNVPKVLDPVVYPELWFLE